MSAPGTPKADQSPDTKTQEPNSKSKWNLCAVAINKKQAPTKNEVYQKLLNRYIDFSNEEDLQVIISIIQKDGNQKTLTDLKILQNAFQNIKFFQELSNEIPPNQMFNIFKELRHVIYPCKKVCFYQGEIGKEFYIILKGAVYIIVTDEKTAADQKRVFEESLIQEQKKREQMEKKKSLLPITTSTLKKRLTVIADEENIDQEYIKNQFPNSTILAKLETGSSFGEVALKDCIPRTATVICSKSTNFITLRREPFRRFLESYYELVQQQNISFVREVSIFNNWSDQMINQMYYYFEKRHMRMNQIVYKEGQTPDGIYLIKQGEIKLFQGVSLAQNQDDKLKSIRHFMRNVEKRKPGSFQAPVSHLSEGQMFGSEDIVLEQTRKQTAVISSSSCTLLFLNAERFLMFIKKKNSFENVIEESELKQKWHQSMISQLETFSKNQYELLNKTQKNQKKQESQRQNKEGVEQEEVNKQNQEEDFKQSSSLTKIVLNDQEQSADLFSLTSPTQQPQPSGRIFNHTKQISAIVSGVNISKFGNIKSKKSESAHIMATESGALQLQKINQLECLTQEDQISFNNLLSPHQSIHSHSQQEQIQKQSILSPKSILDTETAQQKGRGNSLLNSFVNEEISKSSLNIQGAKEKQNKNTLQQTNKQDTTTPVQDLFASTIRRGMNFKDTKFEKEISERLHVSVKLHKNLQFFQDPLASQIIEQALHNKIDLENQMIEVVCLDDPAFKKRIESLYPQIVSYGSRIQGQKSTSLAQLTPIDNAQAQQRILKTLKLPRIWRNDLSSLQSIFKTSDPSKEQYNSPKNQTEISKLNEKQKLLQGQQIQSESTLSGNKSTHLNAISEQREEEIWKEQGTLCTNDETDKEPKFVVYKDQQAEKTSKQFNQQDTKQKYRSTKQSLSINPQQSFSGAELSVDAKGLFSPSSSQQKLIRQSVQEESFNRIKYAQLLQMRSSKMKIPANINKYSTPQPHSSPIFEFP